MYHFLMQVYLRPGHSKASRGPGSYPVTPVLTFRHCPVPWHGGRSLCLLWPRCSGISNQLSGFKYPAFKGLHIFPCHCYHDVHGQHPYSILSILRTFKNSGVRTNFGLHFWGSNSLQLCSSNRGFICIFTQKRVSFSGLVK